MNRLIAVAVVTVLIGSDVTRAQPADAPATQPGTASREHRDRLIAQARARMRQDRQKYTAEQMRECEELYQVANKNWRSDEARTALEEMMERYPDTNRTGCAALYLAQYAQGDEQERLLKETIEKYGDCCYGNGAQVGALARFMLAGHYLERGDDVGARALFDEIKRDYPGAITHRGVLISERIKELEAEMPATQPAEPRGRGG